MKFTANQVSASLLALFACATILVWGLDSGNWTQVPAPFRLFSTHYAQQYQPISPAEEAADWSAMIKDSGASTSELRAIVRKYRQQSDVSTKAFFFKTLEVSCASGAIAFLTSHLALLVLDGIFPTKETA